MSLPVGTLCLVIRTCPQWMCYRGYMCEVIGHGLYFNGRIYMAGCNNIRLSDGFEILAEDNCLMPIKPPDKAGETPVVHSEPVTA